MSLGMKLQMHDYSLESRWTVLSCGSVYVVLHSFLSIESEPVRPQRVIIEMKVTEHVHVILVIMLYKLGPTFRSANES